MKIKLNLFFLMRRKQLERLFQLNLVKLLKIRKLKGINIKLHKSRNKENEILNRVQEMENERHDEQR